MKKYHRVLLVIFSVISSLSSWASTHDEGTDSPYAWGSSVSSTVRMTLEVYNLTPKPLHALLLSDDECAIHFEKSCADMLCESDQIKGIHGLWVLACQSYPPALKELSSYFNEGYYTCPINPDFSTFLTHLHEIEVIPLPHTENTGETAHMASRNMRDFWEGLCNWVFLFITSGE
ncbi:MAG: hypothetical protein H6849_01795 [Alphaproteobacteria bacterium]|nr:MAG: hypothetical protein H6849_01795 [Alphaproteobacteria bacterium]